MLQLVYEETIRMTKWRSKRRQEKRSWSRMRNSKKWKIRNRRNEEKDGCENKGFARKT